MRSFNGRPSRRRTTAGAVGVTVLALLAILAVGVSLAAAASPAKKPTKPGPGGSSGKNAVTISPSSRSVTFGRAITITGQVSGPRNAGVTVTLEQSQFPYTGAFKAAATATTTSTGAYSLVVTPSINTHYEVTAKTKPPVTSSQTAVTVRVKVTLRVSTGRPVVGQLVRFSGTVTPAQNGKVAQIQRRTGARTWKTVARGTLVAAAPANGVAVSKFSERLRIRGNGTYRVLVNPNDGAYAAGTSGSRSLRVR